MGRRAAVGRLKQGVRVQPLIAAAVSLPLALAVACTPSSPADEWLVRVGTTRVTLGQYRERFREVQRDLGEVPALTPSDLGALRRRVLDELVDESLLLDAAATAGVTVSAAALDAEIAALRRDMAEREWRRFLLEHYVDERTWNERVRRSLLMRTWLDREIERAGPVSDAELRAYYEANLDRFLRPNELHAQQIVVDDEAAAQAILAELRRGGDFAELAKKHSLGPEASRGGDLGFVRRDALPESFAPVFALAPGQHSDVVRTEYGYHIFRAVELRAAAPLAYTDVAATLRRSLLDERRRQFQRGVVADLRKRVPVRINEELWQREVDGT